MARKKIGIEEVDSNLVLDKELEIVLKEGATIELISYAPEGTDDVVGWYLLLNHPIRGCLLLIRRLAGKPKIILTDHGCFALAKRLGIPAITVPVLPMIRDQNRIWEIYNERNYKWKQRQKE